MMSASLQKHEENQSVMAQKEEEEKDKMFKAAMKKNWEEVVEEYKKNPSACETKLTKSEQTALHIAVSCYNTDRKDSATHLDYIKKIVDAIPKENAMKALSSKDANGNTPLHLAARHGSVSLCEEIALGRWELIELRNNVNETPLFLAAHRGKLDAFFCLRKIYKKRLEKDPGPDGKGQEQAREGDQRDEKQREAEEKQREDEIESLCRGKDGKTVLHSAISGENYRLAYQIIQYYPKLVDSKNVDGESPLHVLARKPNSFKSSSHLRFYDSLIYQCVYVPKLKEENCDDYTRESRSGQKPPFRYPGNYETCVRVYELLQHKVIERFFSCRHPCGTDEENQNQEQKPKDDEDRYGRFPANYATFIRFSKFMTMFLLIIFGIAYTKIKKMREKKERHKWATQIMNKLIEVETRYKYDSNGQAPTHKLGKNLTQIDLPDAPPTEDDSDTSSDVETPSTQNSSSARKNKDEEEKEKAENGSGAKMKENQDEEEIHRGEDGGMLTPFLIAAKMGIAEIVERILDKIPIAIKDLDYKDKNVLLLAVEHRQSKVLDVLLERKLPDFVFEQVDIEGNGPHHLAAMYRPNITWHLPGAALQMHGEVIWFKHVKKSLPPLRFPHRNKKRLTPKQIFREAHKKLAEDGTAWLIKTAESSSVIAALVATVAFATSLTVPGGVDNDGYPVHRNQPAFVVFTISSLIALWFSLSALVFFLAIITSRCEVRDFRKDLPGKLLMGLSSLFTSIAVMLVSFCAAHFFLLKRNLKDAAMLIYAVALVPPIILAFAQLPLYVDLMHASLGRVPTPAINKMFYR